MRLLRRDQAVIFDQIIEWLSPKMAIYGLAQLNSYVAALQSMACRFAIFILRLITFMLPHSSRRCGKIASF
jgi:hypothetical protein